MTKEEIRDLMLSTKVVPLFYQADKTVARNLVDACFKGGARVIEFTNRGEAAKEVFIDLLAHCNANYPELALGIGSIANKAQAEEFIGLGAHFLVSPFIDKEISDTCKAHDIFWTGGCATLTEMNTAHNWGVSIIKAFPGNILGPSFVKAAKAPCPWLKIMPTGGVEPTEESLSSWFNAGVSCVGMGSKLFVKDNEGNFQYEKIVDRIQFSLLVANNLD